MKQKISILLLLLTVSAFCFSQTTTTKNLVGTWIGTDDQKQTGSVKFIDSVNAVVNFPEQGVFKATYSITLNKNPMRLDLVLFDGDKKMSLKTLLFYVNPGTMKWQVIEDDKDPKWVTPETSNNTLVLKKQ